MQRATGQSAPIPCCKLIDAVDFFRPEMVDHIRRIGEEPRFHSKQWEYAMLLEAHRRYAADARCLVGLGCGCELSIPAICEGAEQVITTDLYGKKGVWNTAARRPDECWPSLACLRVHTMDMRHIDLPRESADFVWAICAIEHVGGMEDVLGVVRQVKNLLRPEGIFFLSTEYSFSARTFRWNERNSSSLYFSKADLRRFFEDTGLHLVEPLDLRISSHPFNIPVWDLLERVGAINLPHVLYRKQPAPFFGTYAGTVTLVLSRVDRGNDRILEDAAQHERLKPLFDTGRRISRRLSPPWRWWWQ